MRSRRRRVIRTVRSWATPVLCIGIFIAPLTILNCEPGDPLAMACCRDRMSDCNRPDKTDDCCKKTIKLDTRLAALPNVERTAKGSVASVHDLIAEIPAVHTILPVSSTVLDSGLGSPPAPSPPQSSILRI